jgi:hypothetical protein
MSRGCAYIDRNTDRGKKAVKRRSTRVKFCQKWAGNRGLLGPRDERRLRAGPGSLKTFDVLSLSMPAGGTPFETAGKLAALGKAQR